MGALNDWMTSRLGPNWRTTVTGIAGGAATLVTAASLIAAQFPENRNVAVAVAIVSATCGALIKVLNGLVAADKEPGT